jgi:endonuclease YncB( thermonuclease family)
VTCLVDGDTIWIEGHKLRMAGYDTPEPATNICGGEEEVALANKATARALELLNSNRWTVEYSGNLDNTGTRELVSILIDGRDLGDILIEEHLARKWPDGDEFWCQN